MNLLSATEKENIKSVFKSRTIKVAMYAISFVMLSGLVMLLPAYFISTGYMQDKSVEKLSRILIKASEIEELLKLPEEINAKADFVQAHTSKPSAVQIIEKILSFLPEEVYLKSVNFNRNHTFKGKAGTVVLVSGSALTRESLLRFSNALKNSKEFSQVEIPVSSFAKDRNLTFSITLLIAE